MSKPELTAFELARLRDASEWVQRLNESNAQALSDEWMQWCRSDPLNLPAFEEMQGVWDGFPDARGAAFYPPQPAHRLKHRSGFIAMAAGVVLLVGAVGWLVLRYAEGQTHETPIGEQRRVTLADGSHVDLGPDSRVSTRFSLMRRDVQLERGQAFFAVAHSTVRPFIVHADGLTVTAVGTAFDVRIGPSNTVVTVGEGRVRVAPGTGESGGGPSAAAETILANVGQRVTFSRVAHRLNVLTVDPTAAGSWRDGTLEFVGEPLEDVAGAINRYSAIQVVVAPAFRQTRFTGTVSPAGVRDWLMALEQIYAVEVVDQGANEILIRSRDRDGTR